MQPCHMCNNARVDSELTDQDDLSYHMLDNSCRGYRIMIGAGDGKPVRFLFEKREGDQWSTVSTYKPQYCPNCGRELLEYRNRD